MINYQEAKGWLTKDERDLLYWAAYNIIPRREGMTIVNIGLEYGASVACLRAGNDAAFIVAIDIDTSKNEAGPIAHLVELDSAEYLKQWRSPIDLLFVDGDHTYEGVVRDLGWTSWIAPNGHVLFHDCYDWPPAPPKQVHNIFPGINEAVQQWADINVESFKELDYINTMRVFKRYV